MYAYIIKLAYKYFRKRYFNACLPVHKNNVNVCLYYKTCLFQEEVLQDKASVHCVRWLCADPVYWYRHAVRHVGNRLRRHD